VTVAAPAIAPEMELSIVMPCLNEAETVAACVRTALGFLREHGVSGEVIVADNGSSDGSPRLASEAGARVVHVEEKGYGAALMGGIAAARGRYIVMGDADLSYDFSALMPFLEKLRAGDDLVMGNRFEGGIAPGAMPSLHRWLGNPVLTAIGRLFFRSPVGDFHCGLRAFRRDAVLALDLRTSGMEFASEMVVKATLHGQRIAEVPTALRPDGRSRPPHLRSWRDGWRHLRFLLLYSPRWLFFYPGLVLSAIGIATILWLLPGPQRIGDVGFDIHTFVFAVAAVLLGAQAIAFAFFTKVFAISEGLLPPDPRLDRVIGALSLEGGLVIGTVVILLGVAGSAYAFGIWEATAFGPIEVSGRTLRIVVLSAAGLALGTQIVLSSFFMSILGLRRR
jgi:glycosyltransferase involved in cell wall biosynthesis